MNTERTSTLYRVLTIILLITAISAVGYAIRHTVSCFLLAFVIAYLLDPLLQLMERKGLKRRPGIIVLYISLGVAVIFAMIFIIPMLMERWSSLTKSLPGYLVQLKLLVASKKSSLFASAAFSEWEWLADSFSTKLDALSGQVGTGVYIAASSIAFNLFNLVLAPILVFFMLHYKHQIKDTIKLWLPEQQRDHLLRIGDEVNASIGGYIRGQLIVSVIVAVFSTLALWLLDVDYPVLNGLFAGAASVLPFIGVFLATLPPLFFAYVKFQSGAVILKVIGAFAAIYFLEGYLVKPLVFKEAMNLNPLMTIIVVMAFGELMGFWGILLAIPIAAALKIVSTHWRRGDFSVRG